MGRERRWWGGRVVERGRESGGSGRQWEGGRVEGEGV